MELILTSLLIFFLPSQLGLHFWPHFSYVGSIPIDYLSPTLFLTDLFIIPLLVIYLVRSEKSVKKFSKIIIPGLFVLINIIFGLNPSNSFFKYLRLVEYGILVCYFSARTKYLFHSLKTIFPYSLILINSLAWLQFYYQRSLNGLWYLWGERFYTLSTPYIAKISVLNLGQFVRPYSTFSHPNSLAGFLLVSFLVLRYFYRYNKNQILLLTQIFILITIPLTFSRIGIFLEVFLILNVFLKTRLKFLFIIPLIFITIFIGNSQSLSERLNLIKVSLTQIIHHPLLGIGLGNFPIISPNHQPDHFLPTLLISELGIPISLALLLLLTKILKIIKQLPQEILLTWVVILITSLADHYWLTLPQNILLIFIVISLSLNINRKKG